MEDACHGARYNLTVYLATSYATNPGSEHATDPGGRGTRRPRIGHARRLRYGGERVYVVTGAVRGSRCRVKVEELRILTE